MLLNELFEVSANPDYLRAAERSLSQARDTQRQYWKSPEEKAAARKTELKREKGIGGYTKRHRAANPDMYPAVKSQPAPKLRDPSTEYSDDYSVWAKGRRDTMEQGVAEGEVTKKDIEASKKIIDASRKELEKQGVKKSELGEPSYYLDAELRKAKKKGVSEDAGRAEAQAAYMQGECMILAIAINQLNPKRYPIGYIWEYNTSAGAPDVQLDDDEWNTLSPEEQEEISKDISRHSVVHAYVRDQETGEYIDARGRHKTLPNLWGRLGKTRFEEFPGTARELIDITVHGDWDEVGEQVSFKRGQPAFDSLAGPAGVKRAQEYAVKYLGVEGNKNKLRIGNIVRAVVDGKRVQGEVIGISSDHKEVELWLSGVNDFNPVTVDVQDTEVVSEQGVAEGRIK